LIGSQWEVYWKAREKELWGLEEPGNAFKGDIEERRCSAFHETGPDAWLVENLIEEVIITGLLANCCCEIS